MVRRKITLEPKTRKRTFACAAAILVVVTALTLFSGCVEEPIDKVISDKTEEISQGEQKADDAGMSELDKFVEDNTAGEPKDPNDASQVIIDGWVPPSSIDPADYITPDGDCTVLKKSTIYHGWEYVRNLFPESKANDEFMGNNKGFLGGEPELFTGILYDGNKYKELVIFNQAFLDKYENEIAYYSTPKPQNIRDVKDLNWNNVQPTVSPQGIKQYDEVYPGIYCQRKNLLTKKQIIRGSPEKEIGIQIRKVA